MKISSLLLLFALVFSACTETPSSAPEISDTELALDVLSELNDVRANPQAWADRLERRLQYFNGNLYQPPGSSVAIQTIEGPTAVQEAVAVLRGQASLPSLTHSEGLSDAAGDHVEDTGPRGTIGHTGSDGSQFVDRMGRHGTFELPAGEIIAYGSTTAEDIVAAWLVDDGVSGRDHRNIILTEAYRKCGVSYGSHSVYGKMCVAVLAMKFEE